MTEEKTLEERVATIEELLGDLFAFLDEGIAGGDDAAEDPLAAGYARFMARRKADG